MDNMCIECSTNVSHDPTISVAKKQCLTYVQAVCQTMPRSRSWWIPMTSSFLVKSQRLVLLDPSGIFNIAIENNHLS